MRYTRYAKPQPAFIQHAAGHEITKRVAELAPVLSTASKQPRRVARVARLRASRSRIGDPRDDMLRFPISKLVNKERSARKTKEQKGQVSAARSAHGLENYFP